MKINNKVSLVIMFLIFVLFLFQLVNTVESNEEEQSTLILVPLDDRPANIYFPIQVGKSSGIKVITPPKDMIGNYNTPGDSTKVVDWLLNNAEKGDGFVLSSSMLAYGGLIASRKGEQTLENALQGIEVIKIIKEKYPDKPIYVYDTIQRLAVTAWNEEYDRYYDQVREWAILSDKVVNLGYEKDKERLEELETMIPKEVLADYLKARNRNHEINKKLIDWTASHYIDYLVLAQDDAAEYGLHRAERELLDEKVNKLNIEEKVSIFPGTDEVDVVLLARFATKVYNESPTFYIEYSGINGNNWVAPFEDTSFDQNVMKHITAAGAKITTGENNADINLILNTPSTTEENREKDLYNTVSKIGNLINNKKQVAVGDVLVVNKADEDLVDLLTKEIDITKLLSYSGWNTAGNALGITVGHATARNVFLNQTTGLSEPIYEEASKAHYEFLLHRFVKDVGYKNVVFPSTKQFIEEINANSWELGSNYEIVNHFVEERLKTETIKWFDHFENKEVYIGSIGDKKLFSTIKEIDYVHVKLPWPRIFEVEVEPHLIME